MVWVNQPQNNADTQQLYNPYIISKQCELQMEVSHMDITTLVTEAVLLLVPYLVKGGRTITDKVGKDIGGVVNSKAETLYETIKNKFGGNDYASQTLKRLEEMPEDEDRQSTMKIVLKEVIAEDSEFQRMLDQLLVEVKQVGGGPITQIYGGGVAATNRGVAADRGSTAVGRDYNVINMDRSTSDDI